LDQPRTDAFHFAVGNAASPHVPARGNIEVIPVPQPPPNSSDPNRPISNLLEEHMAHMHEVEMTLPPEERTGIDISKIETMQQAGEYIAKMTTILKTPAMGARQ
jgi:hypothetical protein